jgi:hypothetical protein
MEIIMQAGVIAKANVEAMMRDAEDEIARLMLEATASKGQSAFLVADPKSWAALDGDQYEELVAFADGKPLVALLPKGRILHLFRGLASELGTIVEELRKPRASGVVPVVLSYGDTFGITLVDASVVASTRLVPGRDVHQDGDGYLLTLEGALKVIFETDPADLKPEGRARHAAFQARARGALVADAAIRTQPRDAGAVLVEAFGGQRLRDDFARRGVDALFDAIEATIAVKH